MKVFFVKDKAGLEAIRKRIFELENEADRIKNELRSHLPKSIFMAVDRRDLLDILDMQDSIADVAQDIAGMLVVRELECPEAIQAPLMALVERSVEACNRLGEIMEEFDTLVEHGFRGPESEKVLMMIDDLNKIETDTDEKGMQFTKQLFAHEQEFNPVSVILWLRIGRLIGDLANFAERTGNRHRLLIAR
jgi:predicted phosphate transport protein (TIGR00153 family)